MTFAAFARWARPRNVHLSAFNRKLAVNLQLHRGLAASPLLRLAAEPRPISGFVEQRGAAPAGTARLTSGEASDDDGALTSSQALAAIIGSVAELDATVSSSFIEILDLSVLGMNSGRCWTSSTHRRW
mmetsp:Transcript_80326/g.202106  ORF Transcript_80326/g.202106 Transcript_80326/m.202106 type:complete len:128 (+) Transcript_80326:83-466(+)